MVLYGLECVQLQSTEVPGVPEGVLLVGCVLQDAWFWRTSIYQKLNPILTQTLSLDPARRSIQSARHSDPRLRFFVARALQAAVVRVPEGSEPATKTDQGSVEEGEASLNTEATTSHCPSREHELVECDHVSVECSYGSGGVKEERDKLCHVYQDHLKTAADPLSEL